jgi:hypothetical protein
VERKPDSSKAMSGKEPVFEAEEKDVLDLFNHLKEMILRVSEKIKSDRRKVAVTQLESVIG